jgi:uncharacterized protein YjbI with pentapeptide repeats
MTDFVCEVSRRYRTACQGLDFYAEHEGKRLCVLHFPGEVKTDAFEKVVESKLAAKNYHFGGTHFPEGPSYFRGFKFDANADFSGATFIGVADFREAQFSGERTYFRRAQVSGMGISFERAQFSSKRTDFREAKFSGTGTAFREAKFSGGSTSFEDAQFSSGDGTSFQGAQFSGGSTSFEDAQFSGKWTNFERAQFNSKRTDFREAKFSGEGTYFTGAQFGGARTYFTKAQFSGESTVFSEAEFSGKSTDFSEAQFRARRTNFPYAKFRADSTDFSGAQLGGAANFSQAIFASQPDFHDTTLRNATFKNTTFQRRADFTRAKFDGTGKPTTDFREATFGGEPYFKEVEFKGYTDFYRANFLDAVKFIGGEKDKDQKSDGNDPSSVFPLEGHVSFVRAHIEKPELFSFYATPLRPSWFVGVDARKFDFTDVKWYGMLGADGTLKEELSALEKHYGVSVSPHTLLAQACRRLSANAEDNREFPLANEFHYWSMDALRKESWDYLIWIREWIRKSGLRVAKRCGLATTLRLVWSRIRKRRQSHPRSRFGLINTLYWALSGYGVRARRALGVLVTIAVVFAVLYMLLGPNALQVSSALNPVQAMEHAGQAAVYSLSTMARLNPEPKPDPGLFQFLVTIEGILGPLQVALLALAIRRKVMR